MKILKIIGKSLAWILAVLAVLVLVLNVGATLRYVNFFGNAKAQFRIPGLTTGFVPQGFDYVQDKNCYLISGYMKDHSASRIYVRYDNGTVHCAELTNTDGTAYSEHAGGVAVNGDYVYLPGSGGVDVFLLSDLLGGEQATSIGQIPMEYDGDFCTFYDGYLFVGDFYHAGVYETPEDHHVTTPTGDANQAVIAVYKVNDLAPFGVDTIPVAAISIREKVQGIGFTEQGQIVLSTSYGLASSFLWYYTFDEAQQGTLTLADTQVPLYYLDSANLIHGVEMPPMSEEVICRDGKVYVLFESACTKYLFGNVIRGTHVYAYEK